MDNLPILSGGYYRWLARMARRNPFSLFITMGCILVYWPFAFPGYAAGSLLDSWTRRRMAGLHDILIWYLTAFLLSAGAFLLVMMATPDAWTARLFAPLVEPLKQVFPRFMHRFPAEFERAIPGITQTSFWTAYAAGSATVAVLLPLLLIRWRGPAQYIRSNERMFADGSVMFHGFLLFVVGVALFHHLFRWDDAYFVESVFALFPMVEFFVYLPLFFTLAFTLFLMGIGYLVPRPASGPSEPGGGTGIQ